MTAQEFLTKTLKEWTDRFEGIKIRYAYDAVTEYHIVEVEPENVRRGNVDYKQAEMDLWISFMDLYPEENLLITAPSDINEMSNEIYNSEKYHVVASNVMDILVTTSFNRAMYTKGVFSERRCYSGTFLSKDSGNQFIGTQEYALAA